MLEWLYDEDRPTISVVRTNFVAFVRNGPV